MSTSDEELLRDLRDLRSRLAEAQDAKDAAIASLMRSARSLFASSIGGGFVYFSVGWGAAGGHVAVGVTTLGIGVVVLVVAFVLNVGVNWDVIDKANRMATLISKPLIVAAAVAGFVVHLVSVLGE